MALLEVDNLRVEFPTRRGVLTAVDDVSLHIEAGEVLGVVGESGAGKSMTGNAIIGLLEPPGRIAGGEIRLAGQRVLEDGPDLSAADAPHLLIRQVVDALTGQADLAAGDAPRRL